MRRSFLAGVLMRFVADHPAIRVHISFSREMGDVRGRKFDLALTAEDLTHSTVLSSNIAHLSGWLFAAPAYLNRHPVPRSVGELKKHQCILQPPAAGAQSLPLVGPRGLERVAVTGAVYRNDGSLNHELALRGAGIALFAAILGLDDLRSERLVRVLPDYEVPGPVLHLVLRSRRQVPHRVALLGTALVDAFKRLSARSEG